VYKICKKCGIRKHITEFYIHKGMADGRLNFCKDCVRERVRNYAHTEEAKGLAKLWWKTERGKAKLKRHTQRYRKLNPGKYRATRIANNALRDGRLIKRPCEVCGETSVEKHHDDYSKPLEVRWLCRKHHRQIHFKED